MNDDQRIKSIYWMVSTPLYRRAPRERLVYKVLCELWGLCGESFHSSVILQ